MDLAHAAGDRSRAVGERGLGHRLGVDGERRAVRLRGHRSMERLTGRPFLAPRWWWWEPGWPAPTPSGGGPAATIRYEMWTIW